MPSQWFSELLHLPPDLEEGSELDLNGQPFVFQEGILRSKALLSTAQKQTEETFGFKWKQRETFESKASLNRVREWLRERFGPVEDAEWLRAVGNDAIFLDAGCGAGMSILEFLGPRLNQLRYLGVDVSEAVDVARDRFREKNLKGSFMQSDLLTLPIPENSLDVIFSEGVLHHTDSTEKAFRRLAKFLRPNGWFLFYVYRRKGPIREFTDDYIRNKLQSMPPKEAWEAMIPLTRLGKALGELNLELEIPESIELLDIPAGRIDLQRFFYWHVCKTFYRDDYSEDEMNHINFDWFAPRNAHRQSPEEVRSWCESEGFSVKREVVEEAGITIIARKNG